MSQTRSPRIRLALLVLAACVLTLAAGAAQASAAPYGELLRFGKAGNKSGQFEFNAKEHALGVDTSDGNSVYVADQFKEGNKQTEYRIQKFSSTGTVLGSATFSVENEAGEGGAPDGVEGIAVDPSLKRVYVLVVYERLEEKGPKGLIRLDPELDAAGILYAFSTTPNGSKELVPAEGTTNGVLASLETLHAQAEVTENPAASPLLEPAGIAVDPKTKDVIIVGQEDQGEEEMLIAAQRVHSNGTLGARWVDTTRCFEGEPASALCPTEPESEPEPAGAEPNSPVVLANGRVLVALAGSEIWEIPSSFVTGQAPRKILSFEAPEQNLLEFPGAIAPKEGGAMAFAQEKEEGESEGRLYVYAGVKRLNGRTPGVISFKVTEVGGTPTLTELGWTAGGNKSEHQECTINVQKQATIAAGTGETVFVFDPAKPSVIEEQTEGATTNPHVDKFGPTGSGCPVATTSKLGLQGNQSGTPVGTEASQIEAGKKVALSLGLDGGNVRKAEWDFGDGSKGETGYQFGTAHAEHVYTAAGKHEVTVTMTTDDLASPAVTFKAPVFVKTATPVAQFSGPGEANVNQKVTFDAKGSVDPNGKALKYAWKFGDGTETTTTSSSIQHEYSSVNTYSVTLTVSDEVATSSPLTHSIKIVTPSTGGGTTGGGTTGGGTTGGGTTGGGATGGGTTGGGSGVLGKTEVKGNPEAKLASSGLSVNPAGSFTVKVSCPAGESSCAGTITLRTIGAVTAAKKKKKSVLTLASGSFSVVGGSTKSLTLHLSGAAKKLLAHSHTLRAKATIVAHDSTGASRTSLVTVTLKLAKKGHH